MKLRQILLCAVLAFCAGCFFVSEKVTEKTVDPYQAVFEKGDYIGFHFLREDKVPHPKTFTTLPPPGMCRIILEEKLRNVPEVDLLVSLIELCSDQTTKLQLLNGVRVQNLPQPAIEWLMRDVISTGSTEILEKLLKQENMDINHGFFQRSCSMKQNEDSVYWQNGTRKTGKLPNKKLCFRGVYHSHGFVHDAIAAKNLAAAELLIQMGAPYRDDEKTQLEEMRANPLDFLPAINTVARLENQLNAGLKPDDPKIGINFNEKPPLQVLSEFMNSNWQSRVQFYPQIHFLIEHGATDGIEELKSIAIRNCDLDLALSYLNKSADEELWRGGILLSVVKRMIDEKRDLNCLCWGFQGSSSILSECAGRNLPEAVRLLLEAGADPDKSNPDGERPLKAAIGRGNIEIAAMLLDHGAKILPEDIITAGYSGRVEFIRFLLERGLDIHVVSRWSHGDETGEDNLLKSAIYSGCLELVQFLIEEQNFNVMQRDKDVYSSPLYVACSQRGSLELFRYLLSKNVPFDPKSEDTIHYMNSAAQNGHADIICFLAFYGVPVNDVSRGNSPLHWAGAQGHEAAVQLLLELGADRSIRNHMELTPEEFAARFPNTEKTRKLIREWRINESSQIKIQVASGINMNNGCEYVQRAIFWNGKHIIDKFCETKGRYFELHRKYQLAQWRANGIVHRVCFEVFTTDRSGNVLADPPKAIFSSPTLRFYELLEKNHLSPEQANQVWLSLFELWEDDQKIEQLWAEWFESARTK